jgi:dihydrofolate reductase
VRKLVVYEHLSLDGVAEDPDQLVFDFDEVMRENLGRVISSQDAVLLGRRTYDDWARFCPGSAIEPFATFINGVQKYVATSAPLGDEWAKASGVDGDLVAFVADLKEQPGRDIGVHGSISLAQALLEADLVDKLCLVVTPAVHMNGRKLFEKNKAMRLSLTRSSTSPTGHLLLDLEPRR